ncbi:hypothetical protein JXA88_08780 [Candidatus Fermentibacteria bacterium]|nr:hypothetical protein [Candidatus Fermentibacteria bacterium]
MAKRRRRKEGRLTTRHAVLASAALGIGLAAVGAFLHYRSTLEQPDPSIDRIARESPDRLSVRQIMVCHPGENGEGMLWSTMLVPLASDDPSTLGKLAVAAWAERVALACGMRVDHPLIQHFFYDERRIAYIDFDPSLYDGCPVGTTGEREILTSLENTVRANLPSTASIVLLSGGINVTSPWGHLLTRPGGS